MNKRHSKLLIMNDSINTFNRKYHLFFKKDKGKEIKKLSLTQSNLIVLLFNIYFLFL